MSANDGWGRAQLLRGVVRGYDAEAHQAAVEPAGASTALLEGLPVLGCVAPAEMTLGRTVSLLLWPDVGGVVLGPAAPALASMRLWDAGCASLAADETLTNAYVDLVTVTRTLPADGVLHLQGGVMVEVGDFAWPNLSMARLTVAGTGRGEVTSRALEDNARDALAPSWVEPLEAGERTWALQARKNGNANTHTALAGAYLVWMLFL